MLNAVPGGDPLTFLVAVVAAVGAGLLVYRDADRHGHYHALSASAAVGIAALVGFAVANLVGLVVATGYVLLLYLLSYPSTPGVDGEPERRTPDQPDGRPRGDAGENLGGDDDVVSVIRVEIAGYETLTELAGGYDDIPDDAPEAELRSALRVKALENVIEETDTGDVTSLDDWHANGERADGLEDWHGKTESGDDGPPDASGAAAWNAATTGDADAAATNPGGSGEEEDDPFTWAEVEVSADDV